MKQKGITYLFDIQVATFDHIYDGKDVVAQASKFEKFYVDDFCYYEQFYLNIFKWNN